MSSTQRTGGRRLDKPPTLALLSRSLSLTLSVSVSVSFCLSQGLGTAEKLSAVRIKATSCRSHWSALSPSSPPIAWSASPFQRASWKMFVIPTHAYSFQLTPTHSNEPAGLTAQTPQTLPKPLAPAAGCSCHPSRCRPGSPKPPGPSAAWTPRRAVRTFFLGGRGREGGFGGGWRGGGGGGGVEPDHGLPKEAKPKGGS